MRRSMRVALAHRDVIGRKTDGGSAMAGER